MNKPKISKTDNLFSINQYLPHSFLAEKIILSCLIINSEAIEITIKNITIDYFYFKNHQQLFKAIILMHKNNQSVDIVTLTTFLQDQGLMRKIGGIKVLIELTNQIPNLVYLHEYLKLIKDKYLRRSIIKLSYQAINSSYITNISLENILRDFENQLFTITNQLKPVKIFSMSELTYQLFNEMKEKSQNPQFSGLLSGFHKLDSITQGFQKSDLIIIAGRPSIGKTSFCLSLAINSIKFSKLPILFFSLEMSKKQIFYRLLSMETGILQSRLQTGQLYRNDWIKLNRFIKILSKLPFFIDDSFNLSIADIRSKLKTLTFEQNSIGLVIIDYLQLMQGEDLKNTNRTQELSRITRSLKNIAREFNLPIIALSQLSRNVENRVDKKPILSDLRESGSIEQDADLVLLLYRNVNKIKDFDKEKNRILTELIVAKQRNGPTGSIPLFFDRNSAKYYSEN